MGMASALCSKPSHTPDDPSGKPPVLAYPLTAEAFIEALEYALPDWEVSSEDSGWFEEGTYILKDSSKNYVHIYMDVRSLDRVIKSITIFDPICYFIDSTEFMKDIMPTINSILDPNSDEEAFRSFYEENCLLATDDQPIPFTGSNFEGKLSKGASDRPSVTYTFQLDP